MLTSTNINQIILEIWNKSDRSTKLIVSSHKNQKGCFYNKKHHTITICPKTLYAQSLLDDFSFISYENILRFVTAHELGHSIIPNSPSANPLWLFFKEKGGIRITDNTTKNEFEEFFTKYSANVIKEEIQAWKNSRKFLPHNYNKNEFYTILRNSLNTYKNGLNDTYIQYISAFYE